MTVNPFPNHARPNVNVVMEESSTRIKTKVEEVKSFMNEVYKVMVRMRAIPKTNFLKKVTTIAKRQT